MLCSLKAASLLRIETDTSTSAPLTASQMICWVFASFCLETETKLEVLQLHTRTLMFSADTWRTALTLGGLYFTNKIILPIQTLWKYNKTVLFFTMLPWTCHNRLPAAADPSSCQAAVRGKSWQVSVMSSPAFWKLLMSPSSADGATQLPGLLLCSFSPPVSDTLFSCQSGWFIIQIRRICIVTIPLSSVCCIWPNMLKWSLLRTTVNYRTNSSRMNN